MNLCKTIKNIYIFLSIFVLLSVCVTTMAITDVLPALILMWLIFYCFYSGYNSYKLQSNISADNKSNFLFENKKLFLSITAVAFSLMITKFYTGQMPINVITNFVSGESLYFSYQEYHKMNDIGVFSINKLPYVFMNFGLNLIVIYSNISFLIFKETTTFAEKIFLFVVSAAFIYFGIARGTNFEFFELGVLMLFVLVVRANRNLKSNISLQTKALIVIIGIIATFIFSLVISGRGTVGYYITSEILYDHTKFLPMAFPEFSLLISKLTMYFGFGFYYVSAFFNKIWFNDLNVFLASFIPLGFKLIGIDNLKDEINTLINPGTNWKPDIIDAIDNFGLIGTMVIIYLIGRFLGRLNRGKNKNIVILIFNYLVLLQMFSFPIGNFIMISSANKLVALFILSLIVKKSFLKRVKY